MRKLNPICHSLGLGLLAGLLIGLPDATSAKSLPAGAVLRLGEQRFQAGALVSALAFSADGKLLASGAIDGSIRIFDAATGLQRLRLPGSGPDRLQVSCLAFAPDGRTLFASDGAVIRLWDVASGKERLRLKRWLTRKRLDALRFFALSPDGKQVATGGFGAIRLWDAATGKELRVWNSHLGWPSALVFAPDGRTLAAAGIVEENTPVIRQWKVATGALVRELRGHSEAVQALAFSPDGHCLLSGGRGKTVRLWNLRTGKELRRWAERKASVEALAFLPGGRSFFSGGWGGTVHQWDVATDRPVRAIDLGTPDVKALALSPAGKTLAVAGSSQVRLWNTVSGQELFPSKHPRGPLWSVTFAAGGRTLAAMAADGTLWLWEVPSGRLLQHGRAHRRRGWVVVAASLHGNLLATGGGDGRVCLWDACSGRRLRDWAAHTPVSASGVLGLAFSPDSKLLASAGPGYVQVWDPETGKRLREFTADPGSANSVTFSADGRTLVSAGRDRMVWLWNVGNGKLITKLDLRPGGFLVPITLAAHFLPEGRRLAVGGDNEEVTRWNSVSGRRSRLFSVPGGSSVWAVAAAPDGEVLATINFAPSRIIRLWETATGQPLKSFEATGQVMGVSFAPDGRLLASCGGDGAVFLWDVTGRLQGGKLKPAELSEARLTELWEELAGTDAAVAQRATWLLASDPQRSVPWLSKRLHGPAATEAKRLRQLVAALDKSSFATRQKADEELRSLSRQAEPALLAVLEGRPAVDLRLRVEKILDAIDRQPLAREYLQRRRALQALERARTVAARKELEKLAELPQGSWYRWKAEAALRRLGLLPKQ